MLLQLLCVSLLVSVVSGSDDTLYFQSKRASSVICPDKKGTCPDGNTCCLLSTGKYGCCPLPKAVCCSDHLHCCPNGYTCDPTTSRCNQGALSVKWHTKTAATPLPETTPTPKTSCPGGATECPPNNTCCQVGATQGDYGCCPMAKGVCCADRLHCCPANYQCDAGHKFCVHGDSMLPWIPVSKTSAKPHVKINSPATLSSKADIVCPGGKARCPKATTCCKLKTGSYGCCPLVEAVCCSDNVHCCPKGSTCNVKAGTCNSVIDQTTSKLQKKFKAHSLEGEVICPDEQSMCPSGSTCCKMPEGIYGCCPMLKAVCCSGGRFCCPEGTTCDLKTATCNRGKHSVPSQLKTPALTTKGNNTPCPGGGYCAGEETCCQLPSGKYGCCKYPKAVCCDDKKTCCPHGTVCNQVTKRCDYPQISTPWGAKNAVTLRGNVKAAGVVCPDKSTCPPGSTCCVMQSGLYGCCPMVQAVCCSDHLHCCPAGTTCDKTGQKCNKGKYSVPLQLKTPALTTKGNNTPCPGGGYCAGEETCCQLPSGKYGCCNYPKAVCCDDKKTCCPHGTVCNQVTKRCDYPQISTPWGAKNAVTLRGNVKAAAVICPDKSTCPQSSTCCAMKSGSYGCCPMVQAVCCSDHTHCCPHGTTCDVTHQKCLRAGDSVPWSVKLPARPVSQRSTDVVCPDKKSKCAGDETCCLLKGGVWGCCPMPKAVCCQDGLHCCPESTTCDVTHGRCNSNSNSLSISWTMVKRMRMLTSSASAPVAITCPDKSECPGVSTCCQQSSGRYGCCPMSGATCCADKLHCCPSGFKCEGDKCVQHGITVPMSLHSRRASKAPVGGTAIKCPDSNMECPDGTTCCKILKTKKYGCCPKPNAICCADGIHCCPQGTKCDDKKGECVKPVPWATKIAAQPRSRNPNSVICPDQQHECPDMNTCCHLSSGEWGCCPFPKAVCCSDGKHCCPNGYKCDPTMKVCNPGGNKLPRAAARLVAAVQGRYRVKN